MLLHELAGHDRVVSALVQAHLRGTTHHAYLFQGPEGVGKRHAAFGFAALMNCVGEGVTDRACGACRHCRRVLAMASGPDGARHPDVLTLGPDGKQIKIDQVREVLKIVPYAPIEARYRVVVVDPADLLGDEAANALLKTLEEPPTRTRFVLITSRPAAMLTTIKSRCQRVVFGRLREAALTEVLVTRHGWDPARASRLAPIADGSVGAALALESDPVMARRDELIARIGAVAPGDTLAALELAGYVHELGASRETVFELLERLLRDALLLRHGVDHGLFHGHLREHVAAFAGRYGSAALLARLDLLAETRRGLKVFHTNAQLTLERLFIALTAAPGREATRPQLPHLTIL